MCKIGTRNFLSSFTRKIRSSEHFHLNVLLHHDVSCFGYVSQQEAQTIFTGSQSQI